uniref:SCAN box domain-containing protein n=1 Tax=Pelusios castaneus TaxID=367368 RepID=A0A8C8SEW8_9SAUR
SLLIPLKHLQGAPFTPARGAGHSHAVKEAILDTLDINPKTFCRRFRGKEYQQSTRPQAMAQELKDACCRWLQPEQHSKAELIDQIVMEQFLHVIPSRRRTWVMRHRPVSLNEVVRRLEDFLAAETPGGWMGSTPAKTSVAHPRATSGTGSVMRSEAQSPGRSRPRIRSTGGPLGTTDTPMRKGDGRGAGPQEQASQTPSGRGPCFRCG